MSFSFRTMGLNGVIVIDNYFTGDRRGGFTKVFEKELFQDVGIDFSLNETFASMSSKNVIRGLHFQTKYPQAKLVSVLCGQVWDVIVDLRPNSPTYRKWESVELSAENHKGLFIPRGFAHGFVSLKDETVMLYQCDGAYDKETDTGIRFDDPSIGIQWPISIDQSIHSDRDLHLPSFIQYEQNPMQIMDLI